MAYQRHGLGRAILGTQKSVRRIRRAELLKFFRYHYRPDQIVISVAGNVSHDVLKRHLKPLIKNKWPGRSSKNSGSFGRDLVQQVPAPRVWSGNAWIERPTEQVHLIWGVEALSYAAEDRFAAFLLNTYLGGGMSSTLFQEIREKNALAYTVYSNLSSFSDSGLFTVYAATGMTQVSQCVRLIQRCVDQLKEELLTRENLQMVKENLKGTVLLSSDSVEARMSSLAKGEMFHGHHLSIQELCKKIESITAEDIRRVAQKLFLTDRASILCLGSKPSRILKEKLKPVLVKR
jgi:predicted Zn-dependent peptidase